MMARTTVADESKAVASGAALLEKQHGSLLDQLENTAANEEGQGCGPCPLLALFSSPSSPTSFIVSSGGQAAGSLFECQVGETHVKRLPGMTRGVQYAQHSMEGSHYMMGSVDGAVRIYATAQPYGLPDENSPFWEGQVHDMHVAVTSVAMSFDGSQIMTAASDGSMFTLRLNPDFPQLLPGVRQEGRSREELSTLAACPEVACRELGPSEYTIEQARRQLEEDALQAAAEEKKGNIRELLARCDVLNFENEGSESNACLDRMHIPASWDHGVQCDLAYTDCKKYTLLNAARRQICCTNT
jgi:hypothetical protein